MTRYLKALGLAMMAAFAFSALSAGGASAEEPTIGHLTSDGTVTLQGEENEAGLNAFTAFGSEVTCPEAVYTGHSTLTEKETEEGIEHQVLHGGETEVTIAPHYNVGNGCHGDEGVEDERTVSLNGCDFVFDDFTTAPEHNVDGTYSFTTDIVCPPEKEITIEGGTCTVHVPAQTGLTGLHATNEGNKVRIHGTATGITARLPCFGFHTNNAEQHQDVTVEGLNELGETTEIRISDAVG